MERARGHVQSSVWSRLAVAAWIALTLHFVAGLALAFLLRQGLETNPDLVHRLRFITERTPLWSVGWLFWSASSLSILYFYASFAWAHSAAGEAHHAPLALAVIFATAGLAPDLTAQAIEIGILPDLARRALTEPDLQAGGSAAAISFMTWHRLGILLTGYLANGLYTLAAILLMWSTRRAYPTWTWMTGLMVGASGFWLSGAALANSPTGMVWSNVFLVPAIVIWQVGVSLASLRRAREASGSQRESR